MIKVNTVRNKEDIIEFQKYHFRKNQLKQVIAMAIIMLFTLIIISMDLESTLHTIIFVALGELVFVGVMCLSLKISRSKLNKSNKSFEEEVSIIYEFDDQKIAIKVESQTIKDSSEIKWDFIYKVFEDEKKFYLYINKMNAYIISKSDIEDDKEVELSNLIKEKVAK